MTPTLLNDRYRILRALGAGGFGNTFLAEDTYMPSGRRCVIKHLKPVTDNPQMYETIKARFQREAAVLEELGDGHNQIPRLYAYFEAAGNFYLVQEWIEGETLTDKIKPNGPLSETEVRDILISLLPVLDYVHTQRIVHRDIKPDNVIVRKRDGKPVLIDFGAVKEAMGTVVNSQGNSIVIGTPGYMAPEQSIGRPTYSSDLYSLGLTAIFLLTGKNPQELETDPRTGEIIWRQGAWSTPSHFADVLDKAIRQHVRDRYPTALDMLQALQSVHPIAPVAGTPSDMATVAVAPGAGGQVATPSPATAPVNQPPAGGPAPVIQRNQGNRGLLIGGLVAFCLLFVGVAVAFVANRSPDPSSPATSEGPVAQQSPPPNTSDNSASVDNTPVAPPPVRTRPSEPQRNTDTSVTEDQTTGDRATSPRDTEENQTPRSQETQPNSNSATRDSQTTPPVSNQPPSPETEKTNQNQDSSADTTSSESVPAFPTGTRESTIRNALGQPSQSRKGYWPNTQAVLYEDYVPNQVSLGYLFDRNTRRLRQTEAAMAQSVGLPAMQDTLEKMMGGTATSESKRQLEQVYQRRARRYSFTSGGLEGVIERNDKDRIYIAVWEADLH